MIDDIMQCLASCSKCPKPTEVYFVTRQTIMLNPIF